MGVGVGFSLGSGRKAVDRELIRASVATLVFPTESPLNWTCARWPEGSLFGHWRSGVAFVQVICRSTRRGVREHPAPSGALRHGKNATVVNHSLGVREHPAPSGALRPCNLTLTHVNRTHRQGAPSTIRCIETIRSRPESRTVPRVREHPAPSGALRQGLDTAHNAVVIGSGSTQHHQVH